MKSKNRTRKQKRALRKQKKENLIQKERKQKAVREAEDRLVSMAKDAIFSEGRQCLNNIQIFRSELDSTKWTKKHLPTQHSKIYSLCSMLAILKNLFSEPIDDWDGNMWDCLSENLLAAKAVMLRKDVNGSIVDPDNIQIDLSRSKNFCFQRPFHVTMALVAIFTEDDFQTSRFVIKEDIPKIAEETSRIMDAFELSNIRNDNNDPEFPLSNVFFCMQVVNLIRLWYYEIFQDRLEPPQKPVQDYTASDLEQYQNWLHGRNIAYFQEVQTFKNYRGFQKGRSKVNFKLFCPRITNLLVSATELSKENFLKDPEYPLYNILLGKLMYIFSTCRPDIASEIFSLTRSQNQAEDIRCIHSYLLATKYCGIQYTRAQIFGSWHEDELPKAEPIIEIVD